VGLPRLSFVLVALALLGNVHRADAFDVDAAFPRGGYVLSLEGGYGEQFDAWNTTITGFDFFNAGVRFGFLPWGAVGSGAFKGAFEIGLEPVYQRFSSPKRRKRSLRDSAPSPATIFSRWGASSRTWSWAPRRATPT
jgi:hypothetical protein